MNKFGPPKVFGTVTVGKRGQVAIPAEVRKLYRVKAGDKLIVIAKPDGPIGFIPAYQLNEFLTHMTEMLAQIKKANKI